jgi:hypothetical protein
MFSDFTGVHRVFSLRSPFSCSCQIVIGKEDISDVGVGVTAAARGGGSRLNSGLRKLVVYLCQLVFAIWYSWQSEPSAEEDVDLRGIDRDVAAGHDVPFAL